MLALARLALVLPALGTPALGQNVKLNPPLVPEFSGGQVQEFAFTPDGTRVVYVADRGEQGRFELYGRPLDGSQPSRLLSGPLQPQGDVKAHRGFPPGGFQVGAGGRIVYRADESLDEVEELFSVPADGSSGRIRVSQAGVRALEFGLGPDGTRVAYKHKITPGFSNTGSLHVAPIDGSAAPVTLWPNATGTSIWLAPDGLRALVADRENLVFPPFGFGSREHLYVVPIDASTAPLHLAETHNDSFESSYFQHPTFTPDGLHVVYEETEEFDGDYARSVRSVRLDGSQPSIHIATLLRDFALDTRVPPRVISPTFTDVRSTLVDGSSPATLSIPSSRQASSTPRLLGNDVFFSTLDSTIFRVPSDGSQLALQLFPVVPGFISERFVIASPQSVAFISGGAFLVPSTGGMPVPLHAPLTAGIGAQELMADPRGQHLLLRADIDVARIIDLYSFDLSDLSRVRLSHQETPVTGVSEARFAPGGQVVYRTGNALNPSGSDLFVTPVDGSQSPMQLNELFPTGGFLGDVSGFRVTKDGKKLVYRADQKEDEEQDLFAVNLASPGAPVLLTESVPDVQPQFLVLEPPGLVLFQVQASGTRLHVANLKGSTSTELDVATFGFGPTFATAHAGRRLVYRKSLTSGSFGLWSTLLDGSSPPVRLHPSFGAARTVSDFRVAGDGTVVFLSDLRQDDVFELFTVPVKGGTPRRISGPMVARGDVESFEVDPSGKFVAFLADALVDERFELFTLPLDGSQAPVRRSGPMPLLGDVSTFAFAGDGRHLVYLADPIRDQRLDLFSTPILAGSGAGGGHRLGALGATLLSRHSALHRVLPDFVLAEDGSVVLYRVAQDGSGTELYLVPVDGGASPTPMSGPLASGRAVSSAALAADGRRVVYLADPLADERFELFSVPSSGGTPVSLDSMPDPGDVVGFQITRDSTHVVFRADRDADEVFELYRVPTDGSAPATRVSGPLVSGGDTRPDFVALDGTTLYIADQEKDEVFELFSSR